MIEQIPLTIWPDYLGVVAPNQDSNKTDTLLAPCLEGSFFISLLDKRRRLGMLANLTRLEQTSVAVAVGLEFFSRSPAVPAAIPNIEIQTANLVSYRLLIAGTDAKVSLLKGLRLLVHTGAPLWTRIMVPWLDDNELVRDIGNVAGVRLDTALGLQEDDVFTHGIILPRRHPLPSNAIIGITYVPTHLFLT